MATTDQMLPLLKRLRLSGLLETLDLRRSQAVEDDSTFDEFLYRLLNDELERRDTKARGLRVKKAGFMQDKILEDFDFSFNPTIPKAEIIDLATGRYIERKENIIFVGPSGVGKSHFAQALGHRACLAGHKVRYVTAHALLRQLRAAKADNSRERLFKQLCALDLLIIDDLGLTPLEVDGPVDLYELIRLRYERGSIIITSNRDVPEWASLFNDPLLASAAIDRVLHHAHLITLTGKSFRTTN